MMPAIGTVPIVDTMIGFPQDPRARHEVLLSRTADRESKEKFAMPAEYMFRDVPEKHAIEGDPVEHTLREMDRWGVRVGMISVGKGDDADRAIRQYPDRFVGTFSPDPNQGVEAVRKIRRAHQDFGIRAVTIFPAGFSPQVPIDHRLVAATVVVAGAPILPLLLLATSAETVLHALLKILM